MGHVHVAITRRVKPGMEQAFEAGLREFARQSMNDHGTTGVLLIGPVPGSKENEYGVLRSFTSKEASHAFYASDMFKKWNEQAAQYVIGDPVRRNLHGLEAFFRGIGTFPPPRWKMAVVTWLGVFPTALFWSTTLGRMLADAPRPVASAVVNVCVVATLTWAVMPALTRLFAGWLRAPTA